MRLFIITTAILTLCVHVQAQKFSDSLNLKISTLSAEKERMDKVVKAYTDSISLVMRSIIDVQYQLPGVLVEEKIQEINNKIGKGIAYRDKSKATWLFVKNGSGYTMNTLLNKGKEIRILQLYEYPYFKVSFKGKIYYISDQYTDISSTDFYDDYKSLVELKKQNSRLISPPNSINGSGESKPESDYSPGRSSYESTPTTHTGPRGGQYYYTKSGKKRYYSQNKKN